MVNPSRGGVILDFPLHPNYQAQLPFPYVASVVGDSGPILSNGLLSQAQLNQQFPQYNYAASGNLIGYFDPYDLQRGW